MRLIKSLLIGIVLTSGIVSADQMKAIEFMFTGDYGFENARIENPILENCIFRYEQEFFLGKLNVTNDFNSVIWLSTDLIQQDNGQTSVVITCRSSCSNYKIRDDKGGVIEGEEANSMLALFIPSFQTNQIIFSLLPSFDRYLNAQNDFARTCKGKVSDY